ncbi:MAG: hypothetical protein ACP6IY_17435 [Promethearchaeia archaeon]
MRKRIFTFLLILEIIIFNPFTLTIISDYLILRSKSSDMAGSIEICPQDYNIEPYDKEWTERYSGSVNGINWKMSDWVNPDYDSSPLGEYDARYKEGSQILIEHSSFTIDFNTDVFFTKESNSLKRHFQMILNYIGADGTNHNNGMDFRGFYFTDNNSNDPNYAKVIMEGHDGESMAKADFSYTKIESTTEQDSTILSWTINFNNYNLSNNVVDDQYYNSHVSMDISIKYIITINSSSFQIKTSWTINFSNWFLNGTTSCYIATTRVYTCSDEADLNNKERMGKFSKGGITTSTFKLEDNFKLTYNDSSSKTKEISSLITQDESQPEYYYFYIWGEGFAANVTKFEYDPLLISYLGTSLFDLSNPLFWIIFVIIPCAIGITIFLIIRKRRLKKKDLEKIDVGEKNSENEKT